MYIPIKFYFIYIVLIVLIICVILIYTKNDDIHINKDFTTTSDTTVDVFDIFIKSGNITIFDLEVIGIKDDDNIFHGTYRRSIYNNKTAYIDIGEHYSVSKTKGIFAPPIVYFDIDRRKIGIEIVEDDNIDWFCRLTIRK